MALTCELCQNFVTLFEDNNGVPKTLCDNCSGVSKSNSEKGIKVLEGVSVVKTFYGYKNHHFAVNDDIDEIDLENISYDRTLPIAPDIKCKKCKNSDVVYIISNSTDKFIYICKRCHKQIGL